MPCRSHHDPIPASELKASAAACAARESAIHAQRVELDAVTAHLCTLCRMFEYELPPEIRAWWAIHQSADKAREMKEMRDALL